MNCPLDGEAHAVRKKIPIDQHTLQTGDSVKVEMAAEYFVEKLGSFGGGFVAGYYGSNAAIGVEPELQAVACLAFMKYGDPAPKRQVIGW